METSSITEGEVRTAAERLVQFHERFAPHFGKEQDHAYTYVKGLMICPERKSIEPIALNVGDGKVSAMQKFINIAPWDYEDIQAEVQGFFLDELVPTAVDGPIGVVGVVDESGFAKKGDHSAGVARQHNGRLGKEDNCQVGVFLVGVTPGGTALWDHRLYVPEPWCEDSQAGNERRDQAHIPETVGFQTKPRIAAGLLRQTAALGVVPLDGITADEEYGRNGDFLDELETLEHRYVVEIRSLRRSGPRSRPRASRRMAVGVVCRRDRAERPSRRCPRWCRRWGPRRGRPCVGQGAKGPLVFEFAAVRVWAVRHGQAGPPIWLLVRRSLEETPETKYYGSNAEASTPLGVLARVACSRHKVEEFFEDGKSYLGMAQYETRSWIGWHHHISLVAMAHLFITLTCRDLKKTPELTLQRAMEIPGLSLEVALLLVDYHIHRNETARRSHTKTWKSRHEGVKFLRL